MTDTDALYAAILKHPGDDAPRLMYADALDERAEGADVLRAEFIRKQIEMHRIGEPYLRVEGDVRAGSHRHWNVDADGTGVKVGHRVDLHQNSYNKRRGLTDRDDWKGLSVTRIEPVDPGNGIVTLCLDKDEFAGPYPQKRRNELMSRCIDLATELEPAEWMGPGWNYQWPKNRREDEFVLYRPPGVYPSPKLRIERGFPSVVITDWAVWAVGHRLPACELVRRHPISKVCFVGGMELPLLQRANKTTSRFSLPAPMSDVSLTMTDKEYRSLYAGSEWKEPSPAESEITRRLLHKAWPTVLEWDLDEDGDRNYDPSDWSQIRRSRRAAPDS